MNTAAWRWPAQRTRRSHEDLLKDEPRRRAINRYRHGLKRRAVRPETCGAVVARYRTTPVFARHPRARLNHKKDRPQAGTRRTGGRLPLVFFNRGGGGRTRRISTRLEGRLRLPNLHAHGPDSAAATSGWVWSPTLACGNAALLVLRCDHRHRDTPPLAWPAGVMIEGGALGS